MAQTLRIISVGKAHDTHLAAAIAEYRKRLSPYIKIVWELIAPKPEATRFNGVASESQRIIKSLKEAEYVILLDETGKLYSSPEFSTTLYTALESHKYVCIIIGGAYGVDETVKKRANCTLSFGKMVFPHQLVRLMLIEQVYRAASIRIGNGYHHD
jgi:23S rRNA (pseudouridine1915-N3)-methyltransferase